MNEVEEFKNGLSMMLVLDQRKDINTILPLLQTGKFHHTLDDHLITFYWKSIEQMKQQKTAYEQANECDSK
ncbi:hypothetical protein [Paenibacillus sp. Mc5Re-14]|uniref:hypothetical protein n=1 Tax=Paenibacillus sp. Mc5Re-14 TaxID=1030529 RepID=UPI000AFAD3DF|nr:hypothetical protein [Paenibacillus sp. Mc5Re-14]